MIKELIEPLVDNIAEQILLFVPYMGKKYTYLL
jgi:hypothetical protein